MKKHIKESITLMQNLLNDFDARTKGTLNYHIESQKKELVEMSEKIEEQKTQASLDLAKLKEEFVPINERIEKISHELDKTV